MTTNHPDLTPPPAEPAPSLRPVEELQADIEAKDDWSKTLAENRAAADRLADDFPALLARLRAAEETLAAVGALAEEWRYKGEFGWGSWQEGHGPDESDYALDQASAELRAALAEGASR